MHAANHTAQSPCCTSLIHASCVALDGHGVVLTGPSGSGKSSLALRLIDAGFTLVADDRLSLSNSQIRPAPGLAGMIGIRGLGIVSMPAMDRASLSLHIALSPGFVPARLPEASVHPEWGVWSMTLDGFHADAVAVIRTALRCLSGSLTLLCGLNGGTLACKPLPIPVETV